MTAAATARELVRGLVKPEPGDTVARQISEAAKLLRMDRSDRDLRRVRDAWYGRAGPKILHEIRARIDRDYETQIARAIEAMNETDAEFFAPHVEALGQLLRKGNDVGGT